ncbi:hypothetical protein G6R27_00665 [Fructobacillus sp. M1-10]|uniref:Uncharacterized protein n=1 Tax=Fructobacillus papyriferae TaxID=2713171 RepID=A0ABS5QN78_9LACO|nr:hypothetical protein [Fructobacillus papyriferae]
MSEFRSEHGFLADFYRVTAGVQAAETVIARAREQIGQPLPTQDKGESPNALITSSNLAPLSK